MPGEPSSRRASERRSVALENFKSFTASKVIPSKARLERRRKIRLGPSEQDVATAVSSSGWVAAATATDVRLYCLNDKDLNNKGIQPNEVHKICMRNKGEKIRAIALSDDLLAIATYNRLIVYEYKVLGGFKDVMNDRVIDQDGTWTPKSVSILQSGSVGSRSGATAWIAVGGEGQTGVKAFKYSYGNCWGSNGDRVILKCPHNSDAFKLVGFSPARLNTMQQVMVYGVTTGNRVHCWAIRERQSGMQDNRPFWSIDSNKTPSEASHRGNITSASILASPTGRPYMFCTVDHKHGSHLIRSFIAPINFSQRFLRDDDVDVYPLPDTVVGRNVLAGAATPNGQFVITLEGDTLKLLTLQGGYEGGLTCSTKTSDWPAPLKTSSGSASAISILVEESLGRLKVTAVDGGGTVIFAEISVPGMPAPPTPTLEGPRTFELPNCFAIGELPSPSEGTIRHSVSTATDSQIGDRVEIIPG